LPASGGNPSPGACLSSNTCGAGWICEYAIGTQTGTCVQANRCRQDSVPYCGVAGTFYGSSNCPQFPVVHPGPCDSGGSFGPPPVTTCPAGLVFDPSQGQCVPSTGPILSGPRI
jgi:hypothetical protein